MGDDVACCESKFFVFVMVVIGLVLFAGLMAGLTLGLMSLGLVDLEVISKSGRPQDRKHASKILPVVKNQHLLLCTLLIGNSLAMESLPIFLDKLVPPWAAILVSVTLILMFGEILPQAICTRYGLTVGANVAPFVHLLLWVFFPIAYPIIDPDDSVPLRKMLIRKIPRVSEDMPLYDILNEFQKGHSHIAVVYRDSKQTLQKIKQDNQNFTIKTVTHGAEAILKNGEDLVKKSPPATPAFRKRHKGCSFCILDLESSPIPQFPPNQEVVGVISMEDVIEELLQEEILDETDEYVNIHNRIKINMNASQESNSIQPTPPASAI